jgi:outer membrane lipoprotein SlyB
MRSILAAAVALALTACATSNPDVVPVYQAQRVSQVYDATVLSVRPVTIDGIQSGVGAGAGAIVGGIAGSTVGGGSGAAVATVLGAVVGGVAGNAIERDSTTQNGIEILLQLSNGQRRAVVQGVTGESWVPGDPVVLIVSGGYARVARAPHVGQARTAPAPASSAPPPGYRAPAAVPVPSAYPDAPVRPIYPPTAPVPPPS